MRKPYARFLAVGLAAAAASITLTTPSASAAVNARATTPKAATGNAEVLINGDQIVRLGSHAYGVLRAGHGFASVVNTISVAGRTFEVPAAALPYLGRGLDLSLFDVARLPRTGQLPVTISYQSMKSPALPGVTITHTSAGTATGYLTAQSAKVFYAALMRQFTSDHATGGYGTDGMFAHGAAIRLAGTPAAKPHHQPTFPMHTLTVKGTASNGTPATGDPILVLNMDSFSRFDDPIAAQNNFYHGTAKFSLPAGHYLAFGTYIDAQNLRFVITPGFTVRGDTTITSDARTATTPVTVKTPKPANGLELDWTLYMTDSTRHTFSDEWSIGGGPTRVYVNTTTRRPPVGSLRVVAGAVLASPSTVKSPYRYDLSFLGPVGVIGNQTYVATAANLAAITARYYSDIANTGGLCRYSTYRFDAFDAGFIIFCGIYPFSTPVQRTEYVSAGNPTVYYGSRLVANANVLSGSMADAMRAYSPHQQVSQDWNAYPLHSALAASVLGNADVYPTMLSATRAGDKLTFNIYPFGDSTSGHIGPGFHPGTGTYELDRNGVKIAGGSASKYLQFFQDVTVSPAPSTYRLTLTANRAIKPFVLSTRTSTVWTWRSAHESGTALPTAWVCPTLTFPLRRDCASQPLLTLGYKVAGLGLSGSAPAGAQVVGISVGHQQLATASPTTGVSASFSVDGGKSWQPATVKGSGATWAASFSAPAGTKVSLKVTATDKNGGAITETALDAYAISSSAASAAYRPARCATAKAGQFACDLLYSPQAPAVRAAAAGIDAALAGPTGWGATAIEKAYRLPVSRAGGTIAVVDAYDTPKLEAYLNTYRKQYGLPPCTTANGCFRKVNQNGQSAPLAQNGTGSGWDLETTLDVDMISAACPKCHILVVEGNSASFSDLGTAENTAARLGAVAISNSYGARENGYTQVYAPAYHHPGHAVVASSGDSGYTAASFPANLTTVTAVGGTELSAAPGTRGFNETVWNVPPGPTTGGGASGSGCSAYVAKPAWQHDNHCGGRTVTDVSAVAWDIPIYNTDWVKGGWLPVGGTSASSPLIAAIYGLAGNTATVAPGHEYAHTGAFFDITKGNSDWWSGTHGAACGYDYLCVAGKGYDAPTGVGTPNGIGGF